MTYKPPYWYHDNIKFCANDLEYLKSNINATQQPEGAEQFSTFHLEEHEKPEFKFLSFYKKIIEDITKNVGMYYKVTYDAPFWTQLYDGGMYHRPHQHAEIEPHCDSAISWVHFLDVPEQKCFRFTDTKGNILVPNEQNNGDIICFPSWVWHEVLPNESNKKRLVTAGNIKITHYDS